MMLRYSFDMDEDARLIEQGVERLLAQGVRTPDIKLEGTPTVTTTEMGKALIAELEILARD